MRVWPTFALAVLLATGAEAGEGRAVLLQPLSPLMLEALGVASGGGAFQLPLVLQLDDGARQAWIAELSPTYIVRATRPDAYSLASRSQVARLIVSLGHAMGPPPEDGFRVMGVPKILAFAGMEAEAVAASPGIAAPKLSGALRRPSGGVEMGFDLLAEARFGAVVIQGVVGLSTGLGFQVAGVNPDTPIVFGAITAPLSGNAGRRGNGWLLDVNANALRVGLSF